MIERIHIENYKCLRDVTVELGDFTILIGPNDSGKSSFLEVLRTFGDLIQKGYKAVFAGDRTLTNLVWRKDASLDIVLEVTGTTAENRFDYHVELPSDERPPREKLEWDGKELFWTEEEPVGQTHKGKKGATGKLVIVSATGEGKQISPAQSGILHLQQLVEKRLPTAIIIKETLISSLEYQFDLKKLPTASLPRPGIVLSPSGDNLAAVLDVMQNTADRSAFGEVQKSLHEVIPSLSGIVLPPRLESGAKALEFILDGNGQPPVTIPASLASGGALLLTAFLTLAHTQSPGLLLFEEPENGLHPFRLQMVLDILRKMSRGELGNRKRQIVLTTHNPLMLNYASPEEVRVFVREPGQGTQVIPMSKIPNIDRLLKEFALGELWYLLGEEKLLEGQPA